MSTRTLLNVDYYRNLLADDPSAFLNAVHRNRFIKVLCEETQVLINEIEKRRDAADEEYRVLLTAKLYLAVDMPERVTDAMLRRFPSLVVPTIEEQFSKKWDADFAPLSSFRTVSNLCRSMKEHAKLLALIEETSNLNTDWNVINPNKLPMLTHHAPELDSNKSPPADNNYNSPYL